MRRLAPVCLLFLLPLLRLYGQSLPQTPAAGGTFPPKDSLEEAVFGVAEFRTEAVEMRIAYLGENIARLFAEKLSEIRAREMSPGEGIAYAAGIIGEARRNAVKRLDELHARRDLLLFPGSALPAPDRFAELSVMIKEERDLLARLDGLSPAEIELVREKRFRIREAEADGRILLAPALDPAQAAAKAGVDYLLYGTVREEAAGYITVSISFYGARAGTVLHTGRATGPLEGTELLVDGLFDGLAGAAAGRPWAGLEIRAEPKGSGIFVDGELRGISGARLSYVRPGSYRILVRADGYEPQEEVVELQSSSRLLREYTLTPTGAELMGIESLPSGANMYLGARRMGSTPLFLPADSMPQIGRLEAEGHKTKVYPFPPRPDESAAPHLLPRDIVSWKERVETKRRDFYRSLGFFILSIPVPVMLNGIYQNEVFGYLQFTGPKNPGYNPDTARGMVEKADFLYYSYFGSLFVSGSLLVNTLQKLFDYIRTGEESLRYPDRSRKD